jgi:hypothetical protein
MGIEYVDAGAYMEVEPMVTCWAWRRRRTRRGRVGHRRCYRSSWSGDTLGARLCQGGGVTRSRLGGGRWCVHNIKHGFLLRPSNLIVYLLIS